MKILTAKEIGRAEQKAFEKYFTEAQLMKRAGVECSKVIIKKYSGLINNQRVLILCGKGKNAGDGFVIAKQLLSCGAMPVIVLCAGEPSIAEPLQYFNEAVESGVEVVDFKKADLNCVLIIDCVFGTGFHGEVKAPFDEVITAVNQSGAAVVSIDVPSGTNATTGEAELAVKANLTIAISTLKYCHILPPANEFCGKTVTVDIGIPEDCYNGNYPQTITKSFVKSCFKKRAVNSNKGDFGRQLNVCGSYNMPGAAVICAKAGLKTGVGLLKCAFPKSAYPALTANLTQCVFAPMSENENKTFSMGALTSLLEEVKWADCVALGCGIGNNDDTQVLCNQIIRESEVPVVLDADGINSILLNIDVLRESKAQLVLTPHPGEMARLINEDISYVQSHRIECAKAFAKDYGCVLVLKGANTVVTDGAEVFVNTNGNAGMAMGGTGDMLTGMTASLTAQGLSPLCAAACAVYIHGFCGDIAAKEISQRGMTTDDMLELLGAVMGEFE